MAEQSTGDLERRLESATNIINKRAGSYNTGTFVAVLLAVAFAIFFYLYFGVHTYGTIAELAKPDSAMDYLQSVVDDQREKVKTMAIEAITTKAEPMANQLADEIFKRIPQIRPKLEKQIFDLANKGIDQLVQRGDTIIKSTLDKNKAWINDRLAKIDSTEAAAQFQKDLATRINAQVGPVLRGKVQEFGRNLADAATELERLQKGQGLTPDEMTMRQIFMYFKWLERHKGILKLPEKVINMKKVQEAVVGEYEKARSGQAAQPAVQPKVQARPVQRPGPGAERGGPAAKKGAAAPPERKVRPLAPGERGAPAVRQKGVPPRRPPVRPPARPPVPGKRERPGAKKAPPPRRPPVHPPARPPVPGKRERPGAKKAPPSRRPPVHPPARPPARPGAKKGAPPGRPPMHPPARPKPAATPQKRPLAPGERGQPGAK